jgi:preprotein translocase subunit YajC
MLNLNLFPMHNLGMHTLAVLVQEPTTTPAATDAPTATETPAAESKPVPTVQAAPADMAPTTTSGTAAKTGQAAPVQGRQPEFFELLQTMAPMILIAVILYQLLIARPEQAERKKKADLFNNMKKNDTVVTTGGIFGTIHSFSNDGNEVVLKVDENSKIRIRKSSIETIIKATDSST